MDGYLLSALVGLLVWGLVMGFLTTFIGLRGGVMFGVWQAGWLAMAVVARVDGVSALLWFAGANAVGALVTGLIQVGFFDTYARKNPWYSDMMPANQAGAVKKFLPFGTVMGLMFGFVHGGISWMLSLFVW